MLGFVLFIRTLAVGLICFLCSIVTGKVVTNALKYFYPDTSRTTEGFIGLGILITFWVIYRRYFQQYLYVDDDDEKA